MVAHDSDADRAESPSPIDAGASPIAVATPMEDVEEEEEDSSSEESSSSEEEEAAPAAAAAAPPPAATVAHAPPRGKGPFIIPRAHNPTQVSGFVPLRKKSEAERLKEERMTRKVYNRIRMQALKEIKKFQASVEHVIPHAPFLRLVREIAEGIMPGVRFQSGAIDALQEAAEGTVTLIVYLISCSGYCSDA